MPSIEDELELEIEAERAAALIETEEWKSFAQKFDMDDPRNQNLWNWLVIARLGRDASLEQRQRLLSTVIKAGGIVRLPHIKDEHGNTLLAAGQYEFERVSESAEEPQVPVDRNGHPLSESQQRWSEYRQFSETHSSRECENRAKADAGYRSFRVKNYEREASETPSTQFSIAGQAATENKPTITPELIAFAETYRHTSTDEVRKLRSPSISPLTFEAYNKNLEAALAAGLIGR
jgi:hypothetical protein